MPAQRFEYTAFDKRDHIIVSILFVDDDIGKKIEVGSLIFNDPSKVRGHSYQFQYWKTTMKWSDCHVFMGIEYD